MSKECPRQPTALADRLTALLPPDGTPVLNRVLRIILPRDTGSTIRDELYEKARNKLFDEGQIGRLRGQVGQIFLAKSDKPDGETEPGDLQGDACMSAKIIAVANMKGGVGKTATVVGLAESLAADTAAKVLVIDLDAQASASIVFAGDDRLARIIEDGRTIDAFLEDYILEGREKHFQDCIAANVSPVTHGGAALSISLLASSPALRPLELQLLYKITKLNFSLHEVVGYFYHLIKTQLDGLREEYDYVLLDCAPGISTLTEASIRLADLVIVPTIPDTLSTYGLQAFCNSIFTGALARDSRFHSAKSRPYVLITRRNMVTSDHRNVAARITVESQRIDPPFRLFRAQILERTAIAVAIGKTNKPISYSEKWGPEVIGLFSGLVLEIKGALNDVVD